MIQAPEIPGVERHEYADAAYKQQKFIERQGLSEVELIAFRRWAFAQRDQWINGKAWYRWYHFLCHDDTPGGLEMQSWLVLRWLAAVRAMHDQAVMDDAAWLRNRTDRGELTERAKKAIRDNRRRILAQKKRREAERLAAERARNEARKVALARRARLYEAWRGGETLAAIGRREGVTGSAVGAMLARYESWLDRHEKNAAMLLKCSTFRAHQAAPLIIADEPESLGEWQSWTPEAQHLEIAASRRDVLILA